MCAPRASAIQAYMTLHNVADELHKHIHRHCGPLNDSKSCGICILDIRAALTAHCMRIDVLKLIRTKMMQSDKILEHARRATDVVVVVSKSL